MLYYQCPLLMENFRLILKTQHCPTLYPSHATRFYIPQLEPHNAGIQHCFHRRTSLRIYNKMSIKYRSGSTRPNSERSSSSASSQGAPQINGVLVSLPTTSVLKARSAPPSSSSTSSASEQLCRTPGLPRTPVKQRSKAAATCLMQPFTVLSQRLVNCLQSFPNIC